RLKLGNDKRHTDSRPSDKTMNTSLLEDRNQEKV
ncbi:unnamed protein product, partial [Rotaria magnacalcarata]